MSDPFTTPTAVHGTMDAMTSSSRRVNAVGFVVADMASTLAFYARCGLAVPADASHQPHVDVTCTADSG